MIINIYNNSPYFLKVIFLNLLSIKKNYYKYGMYYNKYYKELVYDLDFNKDDKLKKFLELAIKYTNFYKDIPSLKLNDFPIIDKNNINNSNYSNFIDLKNSKIFNQYSSGSTGQPFKVPTTLEAYQLEYAFWWYHRSFAGVKKGDRVATIAGHNVIPVKKNKPPYWIHNYYDNQIIFSSYHLKKENLKLYIEKLNHFKPVMIHAYPSSIYLIARFILNNNIELDFRPKMIQTISETLHSYQRKAIESAFQAKVYMWYGNTELCGHITECNFGKLHVQPRHSYIRVLDDNNEDVEPGGKGRIVGTNFNNRCFPLINYDTGDVVTVSKNQSCSCGQEGLIIERIDGRIEDYIYLPDGRKVGRLDHIFKHDLPVMNAQIVQHKINEIILRVVKTDNYTPKHEKEILSEARNRLGEEVTILFDYVSHIPKERNGKYRFIKQQLDIDNATFN